MTRTEPPPLELPDLDDVQQAPQLALLSALDATLCATTAALNARHSTSRVTYWADADDDVRLAAAIVAGAHTLRLLLAEYEAATHIRNFNEIPF